MFITTWHSGNTLQRVESLAFDTIEAAETRIRDSIKGGRGKGTLYARNRRTKR